MNVFLLTDLEGIPGVLSIDAIASGTAAKIGEKLKQYKQLDTLTIDGENVIENGYWAYHLDESSRETTVLQLFYEKVR